MSLEVKKAAHQRALDEWAGQSKVRLQDGSLRVMYHGTGADIKVFRPSARGEYGAGIYCTSSIDLANEYAASSNGGNVMPLYVRIENPIPAPELERIVAKYHDSSSDWSPQDISDEIEMAGYDGILLSQGGEVFAMALQANQLKSALGNNGTYDHLSPDLRFSTNHAVDEVSSTPQEVSSAIAELVGVQALQLEQNVGQVVVTTSDQVDALVARDRKDAFDRWFGESVVRDSVGAPLRVYHGSKNEFSTFDKAKIGRENGRSEGPGFYFTVDKDIAQSYAQGGYLHEVFLAIKNPLSYEAKGFSLGQLVNLIKRVAELELQETDSDWRDGFLSNWTDTYADGANLSKAAQSAALLLVEEERALDQLGGLIGGGVAPAIVNQALTETLGYDGYVSKGFGNVGKTGLIYVAMEPWQIRAVADCTPELTQDVLKSFAGARAVGAPLEDLEHAKRMDLQGIDQEEVRQKTGWHRGAEGLWRFEISDEEFHVNKRLLSNLRKGGFESKYIERVTYRKDADQTYRLSLAPPSPQATDEFVSLSGIGENLLSALLPKEVVSLIHSGEGQEDFIGSDWAEAKCAVAPFNFGGLNAFMLHEVVDHPALFAAYPQLREVAVQVDPKLMMGASASFVSYSNGESGYVISVANPTSKDVERQFIHEIQHVIQAIEGLARGGSHEEFSSLDVTEKSVKALNEQIFHLLDSDPQFGSLRREHTRDWIRIVAEYGTRDEEGRERLSWDDVPGPQRDAYFARMDRLGEFPQHWEYMDLESERRRLLRERVIISPFEQYRKLAGEVEARNVEVRMRMNAAVRKLTSPTATEDVPREEQVVRLRKAWDGAQAFHDRQSGTTYFLADRIPAGKEASVFLHEVVHRHGRSHLPEGQFDALVGQVKAWAGHAQGSTERSIHDKAAGRVAAAGVSGPVADEELFAYAVEEAVAMGVQPSAMAHEGSAEAWLSAVVQSIQRVADKLIGNSLEQLGGQDLVDLAYALAQVERPELGVVVAQALQESLQGAVPAPQQGLDEDRTPGAW